MKKIISLLVISCFILPQLAFAGAWTLPKNGVWADYSIKVQGARKQFNSKRESVWLLRGAQTWGWSMTPNVEYGITDWFTVLAKMEYKEAKYKEYERPPGWGPYSVKNHGLTDVQVGGKVRFLKDPFVLSGQIKGLIYTGYDDAAGQPGLSDRNNALELRGMVGKVFNVPLPFYVGAETGYRFNSKQLCNDVPFFVEGGFWPVRWLLIKNEIDGYWCHDGTGNIEKEYAIWRVGPVIQLLTIYHMMKGVDVTSKEFTSDVTRAGKSLNLEVYYGNTFWGRNTNDDQEVILKISGQF
ncbi:MAG: hypothetical protein ABID83_05935 [Candidatus Omnitrophota bacterium]